MIHNRFAHKMRCAAHVIALSMLLSGSATASQQNVIRGLTVAKEGKTTVIRLVGSAKPVFTVFRLEHPDRLSIDINNAKLKGVARLSEINSASVSQVLSTQYNAAGKMTARIVVGLTRASHYNVRADGKNLVVTITPHGSTPRSSMPHGATSAKAGKVKSATPAKAAAPKPLAVKDVRFVDGDNVARVEIELNGRADYKHQRGKSKARVRLQGAKLPDMLRRTLDTSAFNGPVRAITTNVDRDGQINVDVALSPSASKDRVQQLGHRIIWEFAKAPGAATRQVAQSRNQARQPAQLALNKVRVASTASPIAKTSSKRYQGRRIDLDFKDAGIHNILRLLSDVGDVNIVTSDAVKGRVTIRMKNVPWDHALDVILRAKGLGMVREGNLLRVAPRGDLEKEREAEIARQKQVLLLAPLETRLIPISYAQAGQILGKVRYMLSPRGKLTIDQRTNMVIARDIASNLDLIEEMIKNLDTQTPQVLIEARIIEARTNYSKQFGIQWGAAFTASPETGNATGLVFPYQFGVGGGVGTGGTDQTGILLGQDANPNFLVNMPAPAGPGQGSAIGFTFGSISNAFNLNLRLSAAESTGDVRIISAPKITTLDNVQANIEQGVQIPFSQVSANGVQTTFVDAKLSLNVRPHVTAEGSVIMKIQVTRNEPDFANTGALGNPSILKKQARTEMLIHDGDTAVIGGVYTTRDSRSWQKVPWFAEIPVLGWLFKTKRDTSDREETLVFITPRIINRAQSIGQ